MVEQNIGNLLLLPIHSSLKCSPSLQQGHQVLKHMIKGASGGRARQQTAVLCMQAVPTTFASANCSQSTGLCATMQVQQCSKSCHGIAVAADECTPHLVT